MKITAERQFFLDRRIPFKPEHLRLGANVSHEGSCRPKEAFQGEMVIFAGLRQCGTESTVCGEWLVYSNQLFLFPAVLPTSGIKIVSGDVIVIPVECRYHRKQKVSGEPLNPTWVPMTSMISVFGLLHFFLYIVAGGCSFLCGSSVYQQGEAVFLEAPAHSPLTLYVDSCVATLKSDPLRAKMSYGQWTGSSPKFYRREQDNRLCFSVQAFCFNKSEEQMFISCHLKATLKQNSHDSLDEACFFHRSTFSWCTAEGDSALCGCCDTDCFNLSAERNSGHTGHTPQPETASVRHAHNSDGESCERKHEAYKTVGHVDTFQRFHWEGRLSVTGNPFFHLYSWI